MAKRGEQGAGDEPYIVTLLGKRYRLVHRHIGSKKKPKRGDIDPPHIPGKVIRINPNTEDAERLDTYIHEFLHAADWHKDEEWVHQVAHDIARELWRLGYRRSE